MASVIGIPLYGRTGFRAYTYVDQSDAEQLLRFRWHLTTDGYAARNVGHGRGNRRVLRMHREILGLRPHDGIEADHINGDPLDNRRCNLRTVSRGQNMQNVKPRQNGTSKYRGVDYHRASGLWRVRVRIGNVEHSCYRRTEGEADAAARALRQLHMTHAIDR